MSYVAWRISYQSDEQAARAAFAECQRIDVERDKLMADVDLLRAALDKAQESQENVGNLVMLVAQLVRALRKAAPEHELSARAMDYLQREGLCGSPLRETPNVQITGDESAA